MKRDILITKEEFLFYVAWMLFILTTILELTMWSQGIFGETLLKMTKLIRYGSYVICVCSILMKCFHKNRLLGIVAIFAVLLLSFLGSGNKTMFLYVFLIVAAYGLNGKRVIGVSFVTRALLLLLIVGGSFIGLVENYIFTPEIRERHGLGFTWTTTSAVLFFFLVMQWIYIRKNKLTYVELLIIEAIQLVLFKLTDSRMVFYLGTIFVFIIALAKLFGFKWKLTQKVKGLFVVAPSVICIVSIAIHAFYDSRHSLWIKLNNFLSNRLALGKNAFETYGISLFGNEVEWVGHSVVATTREYNYVDCSYVQLLLEYGVLFLIMVIVIYTVMMYRAMKRNQFETLWVLLFILGFSITEPRLMNLVFNPFPLLILCDWDWKDFLCYWRSKYGSAKIVKT